MSTLYINDVENYLKSKQYNTIVYHHCTITFLLHSEKKQIWKNMIIIIKIRVLNEHTHTHNHTLKSNINTLPTHTYAMKAWSKYSICL